MQQWYALSDQGAEEVSYDIQTMRAVCGRDAIPDKTILNCCHLLERHHLTMPLFAAVAEHLVAKCAARQHYRRRDAEVAYQ